MRLTLLLSAALASSLMLSACTGGSGSSSAIPGGSTVSAPSGHSHGSNKGGYHLVRIGAHTDASCGSSTYTYCYQVDAGSTTANGWCISSSGNCTSGLYDGKVKWGNAVPEATCSHSAWTYNLGTGMCTGVVKVLWGPPKTTTSTSPIIYQTITAKATAKSGSSYDATWNACAKTGSIAGTCFGPVSTEIAIN